MLEARLVLSDRAVEPKIALSHQALGEEGEPSRAVLWSTAVATLEFAIWPLEPGEDCGLSSTLLVCSCVLLNIGGQVTGGKELRKTVKRCHLLLTFLQRS